MPNEVIERVHLLARRQKARSGLQVTGRNGMPINDVTEIAEEDGANDNEITED